MIALRGAGYLCGEKAIPLTLRLLNSADQSLRYELAYAVGNTHARDAVPILSDFLADRDENVRRVAVDALATLTHRSQEPGIASLEAAAQTRRAWMAETLGIAGDLDQRIGAGPEQEGVYLAFVLQRER